MLFEDTMFYFVVYLLFNITVLGKFENKHIHYFSFLFQFITFVYIIIDYDNYVVRLDYIYQTLIVTLLLFYTGMGLKDE